MKIENKGKVILAGAGPGDPDLISVKALKYLQKADVILTDRLVSPEVIADNARKDATIIYVGKQCSKGIHTPQGDINDLMVEFDRHYPIPLSRFVKVEDVIEKAVSSKVDLITTRGTNKRLHDEIDKTKVVLYDERRKNR